MRKPETDRYTVVVHTNEIVDGIAYLVDPYWIVTLECHPHNLQEGIDGILAAWARAFPDAAPLLDVSHQLAAGQHYLHDSADR